MVGVFNDQDGSYLIREGIMETVHQVRARIKGISVHKRTTLPRYRVTRPQLVSRREGERILDRQAKKYLGMSGAEFREKYESGQIRDSDSPHVTRVSYLLPIAKAKV